MITAEQHNRYLDLIVDTGLIAVIRIQNSEFFPPILNALYTAGVKAIEITMTTPGALEAVRDASLLYKEKCLIGAGTVLDTHTARSAILAGAKFVVSPVFHADVVQLCKRYSVIVIPGTYTPTEILQAWNAGADIVKVFPAPSLGPGYFKDVLAPLPQVRLLPTGVSLDTVNDYIQTGVACISVGGGLITPQALKDQNWTSITETAKSFIQQIKKARQTLT